MRKIQEIVKNSELNTELMFKEMLNNNANEYSMLLFILLCSRIGMFCLI